MIISRTWAMPNKKTFTIKPIRELIDKWVVKSEALDPFPFEYSEDALDYLKRQTPKRYALFDPPYSPRQLKECYNGKGNFDTKASTWSTWKDELSKKILPGGICISFGWSSQGMGKNRGFEIKEILLVAHGGMHNDTICVVEKKIQTELPQKPKVECSLRLEETSEGRTSIPPTNELAGILEVILWIHFERTYTDEFDDCDVVGDWDLGWDDCMNKFEKEFVHNKDNKFFINKEKINDWIYFKIYSVDINPDINPDYVNGWNDCMNSIQQEFLDYSEDRISELKAFEILGYDRISELKAFEILGYKYLNEKGKDKFIELLLKNR